MKNVNPEASTNIVQEISRDRENGTRRLVLEYGDRLLTAAVQMTQNRADAEDLVFRTFEQVVRKIDTYTGRSSFFTWMYRILINFRKMDLRKKGVQALTFPGELPEYEDPAPDPAEALVIDSTRHEVRNALRQLPESMRTVLVLRYYENLDVSEIASILESSVGAIKVRLYEARKRLARLLVLTNFKNGASKRLEDEHERRQLR